MASIREGFEVGSNPIEWLTLSALLPPGLLVEHFDPADVLRDLVDAVVKVVVVVVEDFEDAAFVLGPRLIVEILEGFDLEVSLGGLI